MPKTGKRKHDSREMLIIEVLNTESESNSVIIDLGLNSESKMFERFAS